MPKLKLTQYQVNHVKHLKKTSLLKNTEIEQLYSINASILRKILNDEYIPRKPYPPCPICGRTSTVGEIKTYRLLKDKRNHKIVSALYCNECSIEFQMNGELLPDDGFDCFTEDKEHLENSKIVNLYKQGKSGIEIVKILNISKNVVYKVLKKYRNSIDLKCGEG